ncbi:MAG: hypothetical protein PHW33_01405 [Candidatus Portnoybacteria bacterium]|jgi:hypothetical protein|nr:hypothetical protein [Candidatus Portnoybacteria bacterium]
MKKFLLIALVSCLAMFFVSPTLSFETIFVPLPSYKIIVPKTDLPNEVKAFSGKWSGKWWYPGNYFDLDAVLIVEKIINESQATVVYGWGDNSRWKIRRGWKRRTVNLLRDEKNRLFFFLPLVESRLEFHLIGNELEGICRGLCDRNNGEGKTFISMKQK